jgi:hypothetical protein
VEGREFPLRLLRLAQALLPAPGRYLATLWVIGLGVSAEEEIERMRQLEGRSLGRWEELWRLVPDWEQVEAQLQQYMGLRLTPFCERWWEPEAYLAWLRQHGLGEREEGALRLLFGGDVEGFYECLYPQLGEEGLQAVRAGHSLCPPGGWA